MTVGSNRLLAPVAAPPPPKPPQLNLVASALMPDVRTDTFGPDAGPRLTALTASGWSSSLVDDPEARRGRRRAFHRPPGEVAYREFADQWNALVAAVGVMDDLDLKQVEQDFGITPESMPVSVFPGSASTRWTGGFAYAPENQNPGVLADSCGQTVDLPAYGAPLGVTATPLTTGGSLAAGTYDYVVTFVNANGESIGSAPVAATTTGATGSVLLTWDPNGAASAYKVYGRVTGSIGLLATVTAPTYTDTGTATPGAAAPITDTTGGPGHYTNLPQVGYIPFLIQVEDSCSTFGWEMRDFTGRALRLLDNATPNAIEREFWTGVFAQNTLTGPMAGTNAFLQQSATSSSGGTGVAAVDLTGSGTPSVTRGIQILEDYLANTGFGGQGMIHVAPETSPNLLGARRIGSLLLTIMDNIVVPGSGYPTSGSTGPAGAATPTGTAWIYATDLVSVRLDDPVIYPTTMAEATDRGSFGEPNTTRIRAQRFAAATFDVARLAAVNVTLAT